MDEHLDDLAALLDAEGIERAILVGHSFGGALAIEAAARLPDRVAGVVAYEPPYGPVAEPAVRAAFAGLARATTAAFASGGPAAAAEIFVDGVGGPGSWAALPDRSRAFLAREGAGALADAGLSGLQPEGLGRIACPVVILLGSASEPFYRPIAAALAAGSRACARVELGGLRHTAPITEPVVVAAAVREALAAVAALLPAAAGARPARGRSAGSPGRRRSSRRIPRDRTPAIARAPGAAPSGLSTERGNAASPAEVGAMFDRISRVYDPMNAVISGFQEPRWRRRAVAATRIGPGMAAIDVATGTGKVAADLWRRAQPGGRVLGVDLSPRMVRRAERAFGGRPGLAFVVGDALALPADDASFDAATIAFGMRNLPDYRAGFAEMRRVVRPGGRVVCLEISRPRSRRRPPPGRLVRPRGAADRPAGRPG